MSTTVVVVEENVGPDRRERREIRRWRNLPQTHSGTAAGLLFLYGGMGCALGLAFNEYTGMTTEQFKYSWFIGAIAGAIVAAPLVRLLWQKILMGIACCLALASAIIFTAAPSTYSAILVARYLNGAATGLAMVSFIVNSSEISKRSTRGGCLVIEQYAMSVGMAVQVIYSTQWQTDFSANRLHGILGIIFTVFALATNYLIIESPVFYLMRSNDGAALLCLARTDRPGDVTNETKARLDELKSYVMQNENMGFIGSLVQGAWPLLKMIAYRGMVAFSFSLPLSLAMLYASMVSTQELQSWPPILYGVLRILGGLIGVSMIETIGRKIVPLFALGVMGGLTVAVGVLLHNGSNLFDTYNMSVVCCLTLLSQFFAGLFVPSTSVYLGEAFPLLVKPYFIALTVAIEQVIHVIVIVTFYTPSTIEALPYYWFAYGLSAGIIICVFFLIFCLIIPETRRCTLWEAQERFTKFIYLRWN